MELIILIGLQASGKSTFFRAKFKKSHTIISNDLLKAKNGEWKLIDSCLETNQNMVIDNTNYSIEKRKAYIDKVKPHHYKIIGYYFEMDFARSIKWNKEREKSKIIPYKGIHMIFKKMEIPTLSEGYDELYCIDYVGKELVIKRLYR
jgi:predicted kinase